MSSAPLYILYTYNNLREIMSIMSRYCLKKMAYPAVAVHDHVAQNHVAHDHVAHNRLAHDHVAHNHVAQCHVTHDHVTHY